jgi:hypothetical protein
MIGKFGLPSSMNEGNSEQRLMAQKQLSRMDVQNSNNLGMNA